VKRCGDDEAAPSRPSAEAIAEVGWWTPGNRPAQLAGVEALPSSSPWSKIGSMCRNITTLRGLEPPATTE
jgi:hypothetical protein